ncbi:MAG: hypothetical protein R3Y11_03410 [Pseudomonadota bacterium]
MNNFSNVIHELALLFGINNYVLQDQNTASFSIGNDILTVDAYANGIFVSVSRPISQFEMYKLENALAHCDSKYSAYPIRVGTHQDKIIMTAVLSHSDSTPQTILKVYDYITVLHNGI